MPMFTVMRDHSEKKHEQRKALPLDSITTRMRLAPTPPEKKPSNTRRTLLLFNVTINEAPAPAWGKKITSRNKNQTKRKTRKCNSLLCIIPPSSMGRKRENLTRPPESIVEWKKKNRSSFKTGGRSTLTRKHRLPPYLDTRHCQLPNLRHHHHLLRRNRLAYSRQG